MAAYLIGDIVWVKVSRYPWWPAEVVSKEDCKITYNGKKQPVAFIKFVDEDTYEVVVAEKNILPFTSKCHEVFIQKGLGLSSLHLKEKFIRALNIGKNICSGTFSHMSEGSKEMNECRSVSGISTTSENQPLGDVTQHRPSEVSASLACSESNASPTDDKSDLNISENGCTLLNKDRSVYFCNRCDFSTSRLNLMVEHHKPDSRILSCCSIPESAVLEFQKRKRESLENDVRQSLSYRLENKKKKSMIKPPATPLFSASWPFGNLKSKPFSKQKETDNNNIMKNDKFSEPVDSSTSVCLQKNNAHSSLDESSFLGNSLDSSDSLSNLQKSQGIQAPVDDETAEQIDDQEDVVSRTEQVDDTNSNTSLSNYAGSISKDIFDDEFSDSSDDELPEGLSPIKSDLPVMEKDIVWVKFNKYPFWPALVSKVYTKKRSVYRLSVRFIGEIPSKESLAFGLRYTKEHVIPFNDPKKEEFINLGMETEYRDKFIKAVNRVDDFLTKKGLGKISEDLDFFCSNDEEEFICHRASHSSCSTPEPLEHFPETDTPPWCIGHYSNSEDTEEEQQLSDESKQRIMERQLDNQKLVDNIKLESTKEFLQNIFKGKNYSERHNEYFKSISGRDKLRNPGFGPIADQNQQEEIVSQLIDWYQEISTPKIMPDVDYILDVWVPEAVVHALTAVKDIDFEEAWCIFNEGAKLTQEEARTVHQALLRVAKNISPEAKKIYKERLEARFSLDRVPVDLLTHIFQ